MTEVETKVYLRAVVVTANKLLDAFDGAIPITHEEIQCIRETLSGASSQLSLDYQTARTQTLCKASHIYDEMQMQEARA